jgi:hypothetical protein
MFQAVEYRQDHSVRADCAGEFIHSFIKGIGFDANYHDIKVPVKVFCSHKLWGDDKIAVGTRDTEASAGKLLGTPGSHQEVNIVCGPSQAASEITAKRSGANNQNLHSTALPVNKPA